jgi:hypothetical protein
MADKAWDRRQGESAQAYEAFTVYLTQPAAERSMAAVAVELSKSLPLMKRWGAAHDWVTRARSFDADVERRRMAREQERQVKRIQRSKERHAKLGRKAFMALFERFKDPKFIAAITPAQAYAIGRLAMLAESTGLGGLNGPPQSVATSGDLSDPFKQDDPNAAANQPVQTMLRKLEIEVIGAGGQLLPTSEIAATMAQFYDKPNGGL